MSIFLLAASGSQSHTKIYSPSAPGVYKSYTKRDESPPVLFMKAKGLLQRPFTEQEQLDDG